MSHEPVVLLSLTTFAVGVTLALPRVAFIVSWDELMVTGRGMMECDGRGDCPVTKELAALFVLWAALLALSGYHFFTAISHVAFPFTRDKFPAGKLFGVVFILSLVHFAISIYATSKLNNYPGRVIVPGGTYLTLSILLIFTSGLGEVICGLTSDYIGRNTGGKSENGGKKRDASISYDNPLFGPMI